MNWIKFYWDGGDDILHWHADRNFNIDISDIVYRKLDPLESAVRAVNNIVNTYPPPYTLLCSGGIDSHAMIYSWKLANVPFRAVTFIYDRFMNDHDYPILVDFCKLHNVNLEFKHISHFNFLENELINFSKKYICNSPHITFHIKMAQLITEGTVIFSGQPIFKHAGLNYTILGTYRYKLMERKELVPFFFIEDPELAGSLLYYSNNLDHSKEELHSLRDYQIKSYVYIKSGFSIIPTYKKSGFEQYKIYYDRFPISVFDRLYRKENPSNRAYDMFFRYRLNTINNYCNITKIITPYSMKGISNELSYRF